MRQAIMIKATFDSYKVPMFNIVHIVETETGCNFNTTETHNNDYLSNGWEDHFEDEEEFHSFDEVMLSFRKDGYGLYIMDNAS
jgi:hypothetical protein